MAAAVAFSFSLSMGVKLAARVVCCFTDSSCGRRWVRSVLGGDRLKSSGFFFLGGWGREVGHVLVSHKTLRGGGGQSSGGQIQPG